jgi:hypothetical protein
MKRENRYDTNAVYELRILGCLDDQWSDWFGGLQMACEEDDTILWGSVPDQAALYGIISRVRNLGLTLLSVNQRPAEAADVLDHSKQDA